MRPITFTSPALATADTDSICLSQAGVGAGNMTIAGALASSGVATLASATATPRYGLLVTIKSAGDDSGITFTVTGTAPGGKPQSQVVTGLNASTATTTLAFETVTQVARSGSIATTTEVGTAQAGATDWLPLDTYPPNQATAVSCTQSGTINWSVVYTNEDPYDTSITQLTKAFSASALTTASASQTGQSTDVMRALKLLINSGSGTLRFTATQQSTQ